MIYRFYFILLLFTCTVLFTRCISENTTVYVDNYSGRGISLVLDDKDWMELKDNTSIVTSLLAGPHKILLYDSRNHKVLDSMEVNVIENKKHVLNLLGGATYHSDASILVPKGEFYLEEVLGGGEFIKNKFFIVEQDYVLEDLSKNYSGLSQNKAGRKTYLRRISAEELKSYNTTGNDYWRREVTGNKMEVLSPVDQDKVYDIIRSDSVCESIDELIDLLENDLSILQEKCQNSIAQQSGQTLEDWLVAKNQIIQFVLGTIASGQLSETDEKSLAVYREQNDFDGYFAALEKIDPQVNDLVAFQSRYNRLNKMRATAGNEKEDLQIMENRLRHALGFETKPLKHQMQPH